MAYPGQIACYEAILRATRAKLVVRAGELGMLDSETKVQRLMDEALVEFYDDPIQRFHEAEFVDRIVRRAIDEMGTVQPPDGGSL